MKTSAVMDTELLDALEAEQGWFGLTMYGGKYHLEHQGGRIGPFFSVRGCLLAFQERRNGTELPELVPPIVPPPLPDWFQGMFKGE